MACTVCSASAETDRIDGTARRLVCRLACALLISKIVIGTLAVSRPKSNYRTMAGLRIKAARLYVDKKSPASHPNDGQLAGRGESWIVGRTDGIKQLRGHRSKAKGRGSHFLVGSCHGGCRNRWSRDPVLYPLLLVGRNRNRIDANLLETVSGLAGTRVVYSPSSPGVRITLVFGSILINFGKSSGCTSYSFPSDVWT